MVYSTEEKIWCEIGSLSDNNISSTNQNISDYSWTDKMFTMDNWNIFSHKSQIDSKMSLLHYPTSFRTDWGLCMKDKCWLITSAEHNNWLSKLAQKRAQKLVCWDKLTHILHHGFPVRVRSWKSYKRGETLLSFETIQPWLPWQPTGCHGHPPSLAWPGCYVEFKPTMRLSKCG